MQSLLAEVGLPPGRVGAGSADAQRSRDPGTRFGENLRAARTGAGLSQEALAYEAVVDRAAISVYERGRREPNLRTILKLARALGLSPVALLDGVA